MIAEYIWLDGDFKFRSKARTLEDNEKPPIWNYDGSSTRQATTESSEIFLHPCTVFKCPFRGGDNIMVWCETMTPAGEPTATNTRHVANEIFKKYTHMEPWFGLEQEYYFINRDTTDPLGYKKHQTQGSHYCGVGKVFGRNIADDHYKACIHSGIKMSGINAEVGPGQWEYQVGPCEGIEAGDHLWMARYLMTRICENVNVYATLHPKPLEGDWNGSGCHANYSTVYMREGRKDKDGLEYIHDAISKLSASHDDHMEVYGADNKLRMTGSCETSRYDTFSCDIGSRAASVKIPTAVIKDKRGYFEDRRPASNCDPYKVTSIICKTTSMP
jgi:glutamine synthetase